MIGIDLILLALGYSTSGSLAEVASALESYAGPARDWLEAPIGDVYRRVSNSGWVVDLGWPPREFASRLCARDLAKRP